MYNFSLWKRPGRNYFIKVSQDKTSVCQTIANKLQLKNCQLNNVRRPKNNSLLHSSIYIPKIQKKIEEYNLIFLDLY